MIIKTDYKSLLSLKTIVNKNNNATMYFHFCNVEMYLIIETFLLSSCHVKFDRVFARNMQFLRYTIKTKARINH